MTYKLRDIVEAVERFAPVALQESYDNAGLYCGDYSAEVTQVLTCLDITEQVVDEAISTGCQLVLAHHPVLFRPIKRLTGSSYVERVLLKAIRNNIALYAAHTNLDNVSGGVNFALAETLGLKNIKILQPMEGDLRKLEVFVPLEDTEKVLKALGKAGAGQIGNYKNCSFRSQGVGTFLPKEGSNPHIGQPNVQEEVTENRIEVIFPRHLTARVLSAMYSSHPYEEVAFYLHELANSNQECGAGAIGVLETEVTASEFCHFLKERLGLITFKHTLWSKGIKRVAVCGGSGSFLLKQAIASSADVFISSDFKYHEFFDAEGKIMVADIGHYESEKHTKDLLKEVLSSSFPHLRVHSSEANTNPVHYYF